jgi:hypothetical protein
VFSAAGWAGVLAVIGTLRTAKAGDRRVEDACYAAAVDAQRVRKDARLVEARDKLLVCASATCPADVTKLCNQWLSEVAASIPTVVVSAKDDADRDVTQVRVTLNGKLLTEKLDGVAQPVNPGSYTLRCEHVGSDPVEQEVVIREGERNRILPVRFATKAAPPLLPAAPVASGHAAPEQAPPPERGSPALSWTVTGIGIASLGVFAYLAISGQTKYDDWAAAGRPEGEASSLQAQRALSYAALGVGVVASALGVWLVLRAHPRDGAALKTSPSVGLSALGQGGALHLRGAF